MRIAIASQNHYQIDLLTQLIAEAIPDQQVIWTTSDGLSAIKNCQENRPELLLVSVSLTSMNGIEATRIIMSDSPCGVVVVTDCVNKNATQVFEAMGAGALDVVILPEPDQLQDLHTKQDFCRKLQNIRALASHYAVHPAAQSPQSSITNKLDTECSLVAVGASTGGPGALAQLVAELPNDFSACMVIIQHLGEEFSEGFISWLDSHTKLSVAAAQEGQYPTAGKILVADCSQHLVLTTSGTLHYTPEPIDYFYKPSVNEFFLSVAAHWRQPAVGVLLTGMGRDGATGLLALRNNNIHTIAQARQGCTVFGMPKAAIELDAASEILPLNKISSAILQRLSLVTE